MNNIGFTFKSLQIQGTQFCSEWPSTYTDNNEKMEIVSFW